MSARWVPAPTPGANLVDVRARRTETRGTRHFVERQPNQLVDDAAPALCGQGWPGTPRSSTTRRAWRGAWSAGSLVRRMSGQSWQIVYVDGAGRWTHGVQVGTTRAGAILWLLAQRKAWPL